MLVLRAIMIFLLLRRLFTVSEQQEWESVMLNKDIVIQILDKGYIIVIIDCSVYARSNENSVKVISPSGKTLISLLLLKEV